MAVKVTKKVKYATALYHKINGSTLYMESFMLFSKNAHFLDYATLLTNCETCQPFETLIGHSGCVQIEILKWLNHYIFDLSILSENGRGLIIILYAGANKYHSIWLAFQMDNGTQGLIVY